MYAQIIEITLLTSFISFSSFEAKLVKSWLLVSRYSTTYIIYYFANARY